MSETAPREPLRIAIVGAGHVGATTAYALMLRALFSEIVLIDNNADLARAEAADLQDANALARPARIWAGRYADARTASIAVLTAGGATQGSDDRLSVATASARIVTDCVDRLMAAGFDGIILVAANPVDVMAWVAHNRSGLPAARVIGTGTLLDSSRLRQDLSRQFGIAPSAIDGWVLGEHGNSEFVAYSSLRIGGLSLTDFASPATVPDAAELANTVRSAAYEIIAGKGYTSFGVATAIVRICEAIIRDEKAVLPVGTLLTGQFGQHDVYLSLPCMIGAGGVERVLVPALPDDEAEAFVQSAATIRQAIAALPERPTSSN